MGGDDQSGPSLYGSCYYLQESSIGFGIRINGRARTNVGKIQGIGEDAFFKPSLPRAAEMPGNQPLDMGYVGKKAKAYLILPFGCFPTGCQKCWNQESANTKKSI